VKPLARAVSSLGGLVIAASCSATPAQPASDETGRPVAGDRGSGTAAGAQRRGQAMPARGDDRFSGYEFMSPAIQAMQRDDTQNPAFLWVRDGERRFARDCVACHDVAGLDGVAARYPAFDVATQRPVTLSGRIRQCHVERLRQPAPGWAGDTLLALEAFLAWRSRGRPIAPPDGDPRLAPFVASGERLWRQRLGQLDLACTDCHDTLAGRRLAGSTIPQAHPTGYPVYRLEWQSLGSLQRRLRGCLSGVRAEPFADGADEWIAIELFLRQRAAGMRIDSPGVRP